MISVDGVEMLDVREAALIVHRAPETVRRWVWTGRVVAVRHGNKLLLAKADVLRLGGLETDSAAPLSLHEWVDKAHAANVGTAGSTARDLVLEDRAEHGTS